MNHEEIKSPELNAAQNRVIELDKAFSRVLMFEAQPNNIDNSNEPVRKPEEYTPQPNKIVSIEEHNARKNVAEIYNQTNSYPIPKDESLAA
jgi:hypothetical protein